MTAFTHADFGFNTEALEVAAAFSSAINERTVLITGVNRQGIGFTTAEAFASQSPKCLIFAARSMSKIQECIDALSPKYPSVQYRALRLDLSSQKSAKAAAAEVLSWNGVPKIDIVVNNAGIMNLPNRTLSEDGIEMHLATNHIGHFLFTNLIMPKIIAAANAQKPGLTRVINVSSMATYLSPVRFSDLNFTKSVLQLPETERPNLTFLTAADIPANNDFVYGPFVPYGQSKTANVLFSAGLNRRLYEKYGILSLSLHPGEMNTELTRSTDQEWLAGTHRKMADKGQKWKTNEQGASTTLVAAVDPKLTIPNEDGHGLFLNNCQFGRAPKHATDSDAANRLWEISESLVGQKFSL